MIGVAPKGTANDILDGGGGELFLPELVEMAGENGLELWLLFELFDELLCKIVFSLSIGWRPTEIGELRATVRGVVVELRCVERDVHHHYYRKSFCKFCSDIVPLFLSYKIETVVECDEILLQALTRPFQSLPRP